MELSNKECLGIIILSITELFGEEMKNNFPRNLIKSRPKDLQLKENIKPNFFVKAILRELKVAIQIAEDERISSRIKIGILDRH